jgi:hypothetical protein
VEGKKATDMQRYIVEAREAEREEGIQRDIGEGVKSQEGVGMRMGKVGPRGVAESDTQKERDGG